MRPYFLLALVFLAGIYAEPANYLKRQGFLLEGGCNDKSEEHRKIKIPQRYANVRLPWQETSLPSKIFKSNAFLSEWNWFKQLKVSGTDSTIEDIMSHFDWNNCLVIFWGPAVADVFIGKKDTPLHVYAEASCGLRQVQKLCIEKFGEQNCVHRQKRNTEMLSVGNPASSNGIKNVMVHTIDFVEWNSNMKDPALKWDFSIDAIGVYDTQAGRVYLIDMTGNSVYDVCSKLITPTHADREYWSESDILKVLRYHLMVADGLISNDREFKDFIKEQVRYRFSTQKLQEFYCIYIYNGFYKKNGGTPECYAPELDYRTSRLLGKMNESLMQDLPGFYHDRIDPAIRAMAIMQVDSKGWSSRSISTPFPELVYEPVQHPNVVPEVPIVSITPRSVQKTPATTLYYERVLAHFRHDPKGNNTYSLTIFV